MRPHTGFAKMVRAACFALFTAASARALPAQSLTVYCTPGQSQACVGLDLTTAPTGTGTDVTLRITNLQGAAVPGVTPVSWAQLHVMNLLASDAFGGGGAGALTVAREGNATEAGDVPDRWSVTDIAEVGEYRGYALFTDIDQAGADITGCTQPPNGTYPYYRTCGASGDPGAIAFRFSTSGTWSAGQAGLVIALRTENGDAVCEIPGTLWDASDIPNCVTPGATPAATAQTIHFTSAPPAGYVGDSFEIAASATSNLPVAFTTLTPSTCTLVTTTVKFVADGICTVAANQAGNADFLAAPQETQTGVVSRRPQAIAFVFPPPSSAALGASLSLQATGGDSGNPVTFAILTGNTCVISGITVSFIAAGACIITGDQLGNSAYLDAPRLSVTIAVVWPFTGFKAPVVAMPAINSAKSGSAVPIKFGLGGNRGLNIFADGTPVSTRIACGASSAAGEELPAASAGASGLEYDPSTGLYSYVWKTDRAFAGTCRLLTLRLMDGTTQSLVFSFR
jgi:hypothetical protein